MKFLDETGLLYLEMDVSGVELGARLMQIRDEMNYEQNETLHNSIQRLIAFVS